jgi:hypothetical protein
MHLRFFAKREQTVTCVLFALIISAFHYTLLNLGYLREGMGSEKTLVKDGFRPLRLF